MSFLGYLHHVTEYMQAADLCITCIVKWCPVQFKRVEWSWLQAQQCCLLIHSKLRSLSCVGGFIFRVIYVFSTECSITCILDQIFGKPVSMPLIKCAQAYGNRYFWEFIFHVFKIFNWTRERVVDTYDTWYTSSTSSMQLEKLPPTIYLPHICIMHASIWHEQAGVISLRILS